MERVTLKSNHNLNELKLNPKGGTTCIMVQGFTQCSPPYASLSGATNEVLAKLPYFRPSPQVISIREVGATKPFQWGTRAVALNFPLVLFKFLFFHN